MSIIWDRAKATLKWLSGMSMFYRLLFGAAAGALGGSGTIAFLNKYAIYWYACWYGCRIPVEDVPYLTLAVSAVSFAVFLIVFVSMTLGYGLLVLLQTLVESSLQDELPAERGWSAMFKWTQEKGVFISAAVVILAILAGYTRLWGLDSSIYRIGAIVYLASIPLMFVPSLTKWVPFATAIVVILTIGISMFIPSYYAATLRRGRFGGGVEVTILRHEAGRAPVEEKTHLFLATSEYIITYDANSREFVETPRDDVKQIKYVMERPQELPGWKTTVPSPPEKPENWVDPYSSSTPQ